MSLTYNIVLELNLGKYKKRLKKAQEVLINSVKKDTEPYVPARSLALTKSAHITNKNTQIVYSTPYAKYQYTGFVRTDESGTTFVQAGEKKPIIHYNRPLNYNKSIHSKATSQWGKVSAEKNKRKWIQEVKDVITNG